MSDGADVCYASAMHAVANKKRILDALESLADDASFEEAIERLYFLAKVERGLEQLDKGESIDHEEMKRRVGL
jgi:predicted transcriptional regulator